MGWRPSENRLSDGSDVDSAAAAEMDARIGPGVGQIGQQAGGQAHQGEDVKRAHHDRVVAFEYRFVGQQSEPVEGKQGFNQQAAGEKRTDEGGRKAGNQRNHGVAEDVFEQDFPFGQAFGAGGIDVLAADFFEEDVFG